MAKKWRSCSKATCVLSLIAVLCASQLMIGHFEFTKSTVQIQSRIVESILQLDNSVINNATATKATTKSVKEEETSLQLDPVHDRAGFLKHYDQEMILRSRAIKAQCDGQFRHTPGIRTVHLWSHMQLMHKEQIFWCPVYKASTTSWLMYFYELRNKSKLNPAIVDDFEKRPLFYFNKIVPRVSMNMYKSFAHNMSTSQPASTKEKLRFIITRHPFSRLVSTFRDKLERHPADRPYSKDFYYVHYGHAAVSRYRMLGKKLLGMAAYNMTAANNYGSPLKPAGPRDPNQPIFWEFIQFVMQNPGANEHWIPMYKFCGACMLEFDAVIRFENIEHESPYLKMLIDPDHEPEPLVRKNPSHDRSIPSTDTAELYLRTLRDEDLYKLYKIYEIDFLLFNYTYTRGDLKLPP